MRIQSRLLQPYWKVDEGGYAYPLFKVMRVYLPDGKIVRMVRLADELDLDTLGLRNGDMLTLELRGDHWYVVDYTRDSTLSSPNIRKPNTCPDCHKPLDIEGKHSFAADDCLGVKLARVYKARNRHGFKIDRLSKYVVTTLVEAGRLSRGSDFATLTKDDILALPTLGINKEKVDMVGDILDNLPKLPLVNVLYTFGIRGLFPEQCQALSRTFDLKQISTATVEELSSIEGVSGVLARNIYNYFNSPAWDYDKAKLSHFDVFRCLK